MNLLSFDLNLLRALDALLRDQSTVKAGERIGLSQPAVSSALGRLRLALQDPLFVRQGQSIVPTEYAAGLELPLRRILDDLEDLLSGPQAFDPAGSANSFKISGSDFYAEMLMPALAARLSTSAPHMQVQLVDQVPDNYVEALENHAIDLTLIPRTQVPSWIEGMPVFQSRFVVIARKNHARLSQTGVRPGTTVPIDLFCELGHIVFSPDGHLKAMGDAALAHIGRERRVVMTMPVFGGVSSAVADSDLVALLPEQIAKKMAPRLGLDIFLPPMPIEPVQLCMYWHKRNSRNSSHKWLRDVIAEVLFQMNEVQSG